MFESGGLVFPIPSFELVDVLWDGRPFLRCVGGEHHGTEFVVNRPHSVPHAVARNAELAREAAIAKATARFRALTTAVVAGIPRDRSGAALGWRFWDVTWTDHGGVALCSPVQHDTWHPGAHAARCPTCAEACRLCCTCGLYAYADIGDALPNWPGRSTLVLGIVRGWGRVVLHETGWRSQYAQPLLLVLSDPFRVAVASLTSRYECDVLPFEGRALTDTTRQRSA